MSALKTNKRYSGIRDFFDFMILIGKILFAYLIAFFKCFIPTPKAPLDDEIVLVTGAANGLGKEMAIRFAEKNATVVLWDIDEVSTLYIFNLLLD